MIEIRPVVTSSDWEKFIELPWSIYEGDPNWVPPLRIAVKELLDVNKNPFFRHASMRPVLAVKDGQVVGRVVGVVDDNHNKFHKETTAFFGFFESVNDQAVTNALLDDVAAWAKTKGMSAVRGPMNPSTNHECGMLVDGFQDPPAVMMTYNPAYYGGLMENFGLTKTKDLYAYHLDGRAAKFTDRLLARSEKLKAEGQVKVRIIDMKNFESELKLIMEMYNDAWEKNWGFVPMEPEEIRHMAKEMKMVLDPNLILIAEIKGKPVGFSLCLPDVNQAIKKVRNGKLLPAGLFKLLWNLKGPGRKKTISRCRILTLGIRKQYQEYGVGPLLYTEYLLRGPRLGYRYGEASWILEDNLPMNKALEAMSFTRSKVYRIYDKAL